jgi:uncharacterized protein YcbX
LSEPAVSALASTAVKGTRVRALSQIELDVAGARGDRRFYVIDERDRMVNGKQLGDLQTVVADFAEETAALELRFPGRPAVAGPVKLGSPITARFFSARREDRLVLGPWSAALSEHAGRELRLVATDCAVDRGRQGVASLISRASLERLAEVGEQRELDARRFRMLIEADGMAAHAEDAWVGARVRIGGAVVLWHGHVGRCLTTGRDPETGVPDLPTLDLLGSYRRDLDSTEPLPFGIYGEVLKPGRVRIGDPIRPLDP